MMTVESKRRRSALLLLAGVFALGLVAAACASPDDESAPASTFAPNTAQATTSTVQGGSALEVSTTQPADGDTADGESTEDGDGGGDGEGDGDDSSSTTAAGARTGAAWVGRNFTLQSVARVDQPMELVTRPGSSDLWVAERVGRVRRISSDGQLLDQPVLDISGQVTTDGEGGLLGLAFSADGGRLYASYTDRSGNSVVTEYAMNGDRASADTERVVLQVDQPFSNHNGGQIMFGPDGLLYVGLGDGGGGGDPEANGQNTETLLATILRIDPATPSGGLGYGVPADNPFAGGGGRPEIWLYGLRNPWRFSFDHTTGVLWVGDVGQNKIEEITAVAPGVTAAGRAANLGWPVLEGDDPFGGSEAPANHVSPIFTYDHGNNRCSVTGGYVYRGPAIDSLVGAYVFADYCSGEIFGLEQLANGEVVVGNLLFDRQTGQVVSFGQGPDGSLYVLEASGQISRIAG